MTYKIGTYQKLLDKDQKTWSHCIDTLPDLVELLETIHSQIADKPKKERSLIEQIYVKKIEELLKIN